MARRRMMRGLTIGCLIVPLSLVLLFGSAALFTNYWSQHLYQSQAVVKLFFTIFLITAICDVLFIIFCLVALARHWNKLALVLGLAFIVALVAAPVIYTSTYAPFNAHIGMTRTGFLLTSATPDADGKIFFSNPANGVTQDLCTGVDQHCQPDQNAPAQLNRGLTIHPGQVVSVGNFVVFLDASYSIQVTSETTPHMNITISIPQEPSDS